MKSTEMLQTLISRIKVEAEERWAEKSPLFLKDYEDEIAQLALTVLVENKAKIQSCPESKYWGEILGENLTDPKPKNGGSTRGGVCSYLDSYCEDLYKRLLLDVKIKVPIEGKYISTSVLMQEYPKSGGNSLFPIPVPENVLELIPNFQNLTDDLTSVPRSTIMCHYHDEHLNQFGLDSYGQERWLLIEWLLEKVTANLLLKEAQE